MYVCEGMGPAQGVGSIEMLTTLAGLGGKSHMWQFNRHGAEQDGSHVRESNNHPSKPFSYPYFTYFLTAIN